MSTFENEFKRRALVWVMKNEHDWRNPRGSRVYEGDGDEPGIEIGISGNDGYGYGCCGESASMHASVSGELKEATGIPPSSTVSYEVSGPEDVAEMLNFILKGA